MRCFPISLYLVCTFIWLASNCTALPERSIVPHPADGLPMESELIMSPCLLVRAMVKTMFGIIKMWCPVKGAFTTGRANVTALSWEKKNIIMIKKSCFSSLVFALCCQAARGGRAHICCPGPWRNPSQEWLCLQSKRGEFEGGMWKAAIGLPEIRNLGCSSPESWPGAPETTEPVKHKATTLNSLSAICIFNNFSSERCPVPTGIFASIRSWLLI